MDLYDSELRDICKSTRPPRERPLEKVNAGKGLLVGGESSYYYYATSQGIYSMSQRQKTFLDSLVAFRSLQIAMDAAGATEEQARKWCSDEKAILYVLDRSQQKAQASRVEPDALESLLAQGLYDEAAFDKNRVKLLELGMKRHGMLTEKHQISAAEGEELIFAFGVKGANGVDKGQGIPPSSGTPPGTAGNP